MGKVGRSNDLASAFHYLSKDVFGLFINFNVFWGGFFVLSFRRIATFDRNVWEGKKQAKFSEINELYSFS